MAKRSNLSWEEAIQIVLSEHGGAMRYTEIAAAISARGLKSVANPAGSVASAFTKSLAEPETPFLRIGQGEYALKDQLRVAAESTSKHADDVASADTETGALRLRTC